MRRSKRLTYRTIEASDLPRIVELAGDWDVARMTARIPFPYSQDQAQAWIDGLADGEYVRAVVLDGEMIGAVGYVPDVDGISAEMGYWIGKPWWGRGYATEAAQALMQHCFAQGIKRLTCCHFVDNPASQRIIEKLGFKSTGPCKAWCDARGTDVATESYERRRPFLAALWRLAA